jgi:hypothetical protein
VNWHTVTRLFLQQNHNPEVVTDKLLRCGGISKITLKAIFDEGQEIFVSDKPVLA